MHTQQIAEQVSNNSIERKQQQKLSSRTVRKLQADFRLFNWVNVKHAKLTKQQKETGKNEGKMKTLANIRDGIDCPFSVMAGKEEGNQKCEYNLYSSFVASFTWRNIIITEPTSQIEEGSNSKSNFTVRGLFKPLVTQKFTKSFFLLSSRKIPQCRDITTLWLRTCPIKDLKIERKSYQAKLWCKKWIKFTREQVGVWANEIHKGIPI